MKKLLSLLITSVLLFAVSSCDKIKKQVDELTEFDISLPTTAIDIPAASFTTAAVNITQPLVIETPEVPTNFSSEYSKNKTSADLISEIKMSKLSLYSPVNLDYMKSITLFIKSGASEVKVAKKDIVPTGTNTLNFDMEDVNIKEYILKEKISFKISMLLDANKLPAEAQKLNLDGTFHVKATLIK